MYSIEGNTFTVTNQNLVANTLAEIDPPGNFYGVLIKARSTTAVLQIQRLDTDTQYMTIPAGGSLSLKITMDADNHFYVKSDIDAVVELMWVS